MPKRRSPRSSAPSAANAAPDPARRIVDAALELAATKSWADLALADIAAAADVSLVELYRHYRSKPAIVAAYINRVDMAMLETPAAGDTVRDKLFDLMMRRFDALDSRKAALRSIWRAAPRDPIATACAGPAFLRSMAMLCEAAGVSTSGAFGPLRVQAIAGVYLWTHQTWLNDDSADHARTMAVLDRALNQAEAVARSVRNFGRARQAS